MNGLGRTIGLVNQLLELDFWPVGLEAFGG